MYDIYMYAPCAAKKKQFVVCRIFHHRYNECVLTCTTDDNNFCCAVFILSTSFFPSLFFASFASYSMLSMRPIPRRGTNFLFIRKIGPKGSISRGSKTQRDRNDRVRNGMQSIFFHVAAAVFIEGAHMCSLLTLYMCVYVVFSLSLAVAE